MKSTTDQESRSLREAIEATVMAHARLAREIDNDPGGFLRLTGVSTEALQTCEGLQKEAVQQARRADHSWAEIGALLGISRQAVQQRFAPDVTGEAEIKGKRRISWSTSENEMEILKTVGRAGYHLVGLGGVSMDVEQSTSPWEHRREVSSEIEAKQAKIAAEGWEYVGRWFPFHYFKRMLNEKMTPSSELFPKEWTASYGGHTIRVRNAWNTGLKLFVDDTLWAVTDKVVVVDKLTPVLRARIEQESDAPFVVEIFGYAMLSVKIKIAVNGEVIAGDSF
ncbi:MAG: hypothetical protein V4633_09400 [Pseudomonadota bacterium]